VKPLILVTGASGFVGWHVANLLLEKGWRVRVMVRSTSALKELDAERVQGDLRDPASLEKAVAGCSGVFHVAADYRLWCKDPKQMYRSNVDGTRNLLEAAQRSGVERVVYTSTVGCIGFRDGELADENSPVSLDTMAGHYKRSKFLAEVEAKKFAGNNFPVVIVNPTAPIGDHDFKPTPTGKTIVDFLSGKMPAYLDTGLNLVDVRNVAEGHLLAYEKGKPGERYILGCENLTLQQILERLGKQSGRSAPQVKIPYGVAYLAALASTGWAEVTGNPPRVPLEAVRMAKKKMWVSCDKAKRDLGYSPTSVDDALKRAVDWFQGNGYC
jgi:dihydroflavonol-4-reductase